MPVAWLSALLRRLDPEHFWGRRTGQQIAGNGEEPITQPVHVGQNGRIELLAAAQGQQQTLAAPGEGSHHMGLCRRTEPLGKIKLRSTGKLAL